MVYKESIYNIVQKIDADTCLIFNSFSEAMITTNEQYYVAYIKNCKPCDDTQRLFSMGFITLADTDEKYRITCNRRTIKYSGDKKINNITF